MNNWQLIITLATLVLAIYGAGWLNQRAIEKQMEALRNEMNAFRSEIKTEMSAFKNEVKTEMRALGEKVDRIDQIFHRLYQPVLPGKGD